jgi:hypothetical protein
MKIGVLVGGALIPMNSVMVCGVLLLGRADGLEPTAR